MAGVGPLVSGPVLAAAAPAAPRRPRPPAALPWPRPGRPGAASSGRLGAPAAAALCAGAGRAGRPRRAGRGLRRGARAGWRRRLAARAASAVAEPEVEGAKPGGGVPWLQRHLIGLEQRDPGAIEECFFAAVAERGLVLYKKQQEAIREIFAGNHVALSTPTGSGKSLVGTAMLFRAVAEGRRAYYTCPIKALVSEKFFDLCRDFGPQFVGMTTGDVSINQTAPIICCTAEVLANVALRDGPVARVDFAVMDEFHYYGDASRGFAWELPLLRLPQTTFLLMSATMGDNPGLFAMVQSLTGVPVSAVSSTDRPVPLDWAYRELKVIDAVAELVLEQKTPIYVVNFTQRDAAELASKLVTRREIIALSAEQRAELDAAVADVRFDSPYGAEVRRLLGQGVGLHHAGLLPKYRLLVEQLAQRGLLTVICGTDTLGVGVNVPIRSVLFTKLCKYDGERTDILKARDFHQIAGRAGRRGFDSQGSVVAVPPEHVVANLKVEAKIEETKKPKEKTKLRKRLEKPPERNYKAWDESTFFDLSTKAPEPLVSQFKLSQGMVLSLLQGAQEHCRDGLAELHELISLSRCGKDRQKYWAEQVEVYIDSLVAAQLVVRGDSGGISSVSDTLQRDFVLLEDVSLFVLDVLPMLQWDASGDDDKFADSLLSAVEAVRENPMAVLKAQRSEERQKKVDALKKEKMSYEARRYLVERIQLETAVPVGKVFTDAFEAFAKSHPWVSRDAFHPKIIAGEMYKGGHGFSEYVRKLSKNDKLKLVMKQEGILLRYLTSVHKTLRQTIPEEFKTDSVLEVEAFLLDVINTTDSSLLREYESLKLLEVEVGEDDVPSEVLGARVVAAERAMRALEVDGADAAAVVAAAAGAAPGEASGERPAEDLAWRTLRSRVRVESLRLARQLCRGQWQEVASGLRRSKDGGGGTVWTEGALQAAAAPGGPLEAECRDTMGMELTETELGWEVLLQLPSKGDPDTIALEVRAFAPWPLSKFEPLLEIVTVGPPE